MNTNQQGVVTLSGRWSRQEHLQFLRGLQRHGCNWRQVAREVATRNPRQTKRHAQHFFVKLAKAGNPAYTAEMLEPDQEDVSYETDASEEWPVQAFERTSYLQAAPFATGLVSHPSDRTTEGDQTKQTD